MKQARLIERATNHDTVLVSPFSLGRADDNDVTVTGRQTSRHPCEFHRSFLGRWYLTQFGGDQRGPTRQLATYVRRQGRVNIVITGRKWKLSTGDELAFGRSKQSEGPEFTHVFWLGKR